MQKISAGLLLYRFINNQIEFFLVHPGGPFFKNKDEGYWTIPKGEPAEEESLPECALREFREETGLSVTGYLHELKPVQQKGGKKVYAWAVAGDLNPDQITSNSFEIEWPPHSGRRQQFPEIDRAGWFLLEDALSKINPAQRSFITEAKDVLEMSQ